MKNYLKNESYMIEASKPKSKSTKKSYLLLIKKRKIIMITFGMLTLRISEENSTKNWGTLWTEITRSPVFSHRKQVNIQSAIYTCTYTYNYDKVRASYIYARKKTLLKCAQCIKRSKCVVSHKQIEPKTFVSDNKYRENI